MRSIEGALIVAALAFSAPAFAHDGHGNHHGWDKHRHHSGRWDHRPHHRHGWHDGPRYYGQYYYPAPVYAAPVYAAPAPAPGIHIVAPNVYIPFR